MGKITVQEIATEWGVSPRYIQALCQKGRIPGAERKGRDWMIPADARRPPDGRTKAARSAKEGPVPPQPLLRKSPFLDMTDLYRIPGSADRVIKSLADKPLTIF